MNDTTTNSNDGASAELTDDLRLDLLERFTTSLGFFIIGTDANFNDTNLSNCAAEVNSSTTRSAISLIKERKEGGCYGASLPPNALSPSIQSTTSLMDVFLHDDISDTIGGSLISVPALNLQSTDQESAGASAVLPSLGKSSKVSGNGLKPEIPVMVASVLGHGNNSQMKLFSEGKRSGNAEEKSESVLLKNAQAAATDIEYAAAQNFGRPISYTRSSAPQAPGAMARLLFDSFSSLIESRIKTWTLRLLRHSLSSGDEDSRVQLMSLLATKSIGLSAIVTKFKTTRAGSQKVSSSQQASTNVSPYSRESCEFIIPLVLDVNVDLKLHGKIVSLHFQTDGTAAASFHKDSNKLKYFDCKIDANSLVSDMIAQARLVVLKTVALATSTNISSFPKSINMEQSLSQFGSSLNLSNKQTENISDTQAHQQHVSVESSTHMLQPVASALRLPSRGSGGRLKKRDRSVTWDSSVNDLQKSHSIFKKPKIGSTSLKRSIKSFGKPNSDHFESAKNATFAEFGHLTQNPNFSKISKKKSDSSDVSMKTHHLSTMNLGARHSLSRSSFGINGPGNDSENTNTSFDSNSTTGATPPSLVSSHSSLFRKPTFTELARNAQYSQPRPQAQNSLLSLQTLLNPGQSKCIARSPTMLENILMKKTQDTKTSSGGGGGGNADWG